MQRLKEWGVAACAVAGVLAAVGVTAALVDGDTATTGLSAEDMTAVANTTDVAASVKLSGVVVRTQTSLQGSNSENTAHAACPAGTRVLGGGARLNGTNGGAPRGGAMLTTSIPLKVSVNGPDGWFVRGHEKAGGYSGVWSVTATVVCGTQPAGYQIVHRFGDTQLDVPPGGGAFVNDARAECASGSRALGMGFEIIDADGVGSVKAVLPTSAGASVTTIGVVRAGFAPPMRMHAVAICAVPPTGYQPVSLSSGERKVPSINQSVSCPAGKRPIGAGVSKLEQLGLVYTDQVNVVSFSTVQRATVAASFESESASPPTWTIIAFATCVSQ
jgi:hypothetical protein